MNGLVLGISLNNMNYFITVCSCIREPKACDDFHTIVRSFPVTQIVVSMQVLLPMTRFPLHLTTLLLYNHRTMQKKFEQNEYYDQKMNRR